MITAAEARSRHEEVNSQLAQDALGRIDQLIRLAAPKSTFVELPTNLLPDNAMGSWCCGMMRTDSTMVANALKAAGFRIETRTGGHTDNGYVRVHWNVK